MYTRRSAGLYNSTRFIVEALKDRDVKADIVEVTDNNDIDREISRFKPDTVILEALWVVPDKFAELFPLHPTVSWYVHLHSNPPFLALEGIAIEWIMEYDALGIGIIANSTECFNALEPIIANLLYLPNVYIPTTRLCKWLIDRCPNFINIGCFGAIRPLKNQLIQALAAIQFATERGQSIAFHINSTRVETGGEPVLKNLRYLFQNTYNARLIEHDWQEHHDFLSTLTTMDIGMQVSLTETFNVVSADYVTAGVLIVVSSQTKWASRFSKANEHDIDDIVAKMHRAYNCGFLVTRNRYLLKKHMRKAIKMWYKFCDNWEKKHG